MRRVKIICTLGPASSSFDAVAAMVQAGMNIARINLSHGDHTEHHSRIEMLEQVNSNLPVPVAVLLDIQGPVVRLGPFREGITLTAGRAVTLTSRELESSKDRIHVNYHRLAESVTPGDPIYFADGTIELVVKEVNGGDVVCDIIHGGEVSSRKNVSIPRAMLDLPAISDKDRADVAFACQHGVDFVAQSFVRSERDISEMRQLLREHGSDALLVAKIECRDAMINLDNIINAADAIMIARGDLGVQIPIEEVPNAQKVIIEKCNHAGKPVIVATQMLESMTHNPRPTRAEVTDVANAIIDGADALMLSGETAVGEYPVQAVDMLDKVALETESRMHFGAHLHYQDTSSIAHAVITHACQTANCLHASAICCWTISGSSAHLISRQRPSATIIAATPSLRHVRQLSLSWGVYPLCIEQPDSTESLIDKIVAGSLQHCQIRSGDTIVLVAGFPFTSTGNTNMMKVHVVP